jgi:hypothetical protein
MEPLWLLRNDRSSSAIEHKILYCRVLNFQWFLLAGVSKLKHLVSKRLEMIGKGLTVAYLKKLISDHLFSVNLSEIVVDVNAGMIIKHPSFGHDGRP